MFREINNDYLRAYVIWLPILEMDDRSWAVKGTAQYLDTRVRYFWDGEGLTGKTWQKVLGLEGVAWDIYLLHSGPASWHKAPPQPDYWMQQLSHAKNRAPKFDRKLLAEKTQQLLALVHN